MVKEYPNKFVIYTTHDLYKKRAEYYREIDQINEELNKRESERLKQPNPNYIKG